MTFATSWPGWALALAAAVTLAFVVGSYWGARRALGRGRWGALLALRACVALAVLAVWMRPVRIEPMPRHGGTVPVLVDASGSMSLGDADGRSRIAMAWAVVRGQILPGLTSSFRPEVFTFDERLAPAREEMPPATGRESRLDLALQDLQTRARERPVPAVVVLSDGGVPATGAVEAAKALGVPVFVVAVGPRMPAPDREVFGLSVGDARVQGSLVDLSGLVVARGGSREPVEVTITENGRTIDVRRVSLPQDGTPVRVGLRVAPPRDAAAVYTMSVADAPGEITTRNNRQSVMTPPAGAPRRVLIVEGAPGFEHSFLKRSLDDDPGLEVDAVVRKGQDQQGAETYYVQAGEDRAALLASGFPTSKAALFRYDVVVLANVSGDLVSRDHLQQLQEFVAVRGGGLLLLGSRSFDRSGLAGTPLEDVVPVELTDRAGGLSRASASSREPFRVSLTADGEEHPIMRLGVGPAERRSAWSAAPALASSAALGDPRPGATLLATTTSPGGVVQPLVAVQRYGRGRALVFGGEASWRWKMMLPAGDSTYDSFWRQAVRWGGGDASDPVSVRATSDGGRIRVTAEVRDEVFAPMRDARVAVRLTAPDGTARDVAVPAGATDISTDTLAPASGVYRVQVTAAKDGKSAGTAEAWTLVGGVEAEFVNPSLDGEALRRVAEVSGGRVIALSDAGELSRLLSALPRPPAEMRQRDLWHTPWVLLAVLALLAVEWTLRRRWGLR